MGEVSTIGFDIAKQVFQAHGADATGLVVFRKRLIRAKVVEFFAGHAPCVVALEACGGAHHWAREIGRLGHTVKLIPPACVKPFVKRQKSDVADAEGGIVNFVVASRNEGTGAECRDDVRARHLPWLPLPSRDHQLRRLAVPRLRLEPA
jgi:transposase